MGLALNATIFRAYDIRGVVGVELDEAMDQRLGQAGGTLFRKRGGRTVVVGAVEAFRRRV